MSYLDRATDNPQPTRHLVVHSLGITLWTFVLNPSSTDCAPTEDNVWVTPRNLWVTPLSPSPPCGRLMTVHRKAELSTIPVHGSSTEHRPRRLRQHGLSTQSTGPMTMTRPRRYEFGPEYLGMTILGTAGSRSRQTPIPQGPRTTSKCHVLAKSRSGTRVDPHLSTKYRRRVVALPCGCEHPCLPKGRVTDEVPG